MVLESTPEQRMIEEAIMQAIQPVLNRADHLIRDIQLAQLEDVLEIPEGRHAR